MRLICSLLLVYGSLTECNAFIFKRSMEVEAELSYWEEWDYTIPKSLLPACL